MNKQYEVNERSLKKYHAIVAQLFTQFGKAEVRQLSKTKNTKADILSKLASSITIEQRGKILLEHRATLSCDSQQVLDLNQEQSWMTLIIKLNKGKLSSSTKKR